ncbi:hypothetical protein PPL_11783 [Heterostelium album PN500]|uniref:Fucosyltransferase n=1 Tax=Heterostelium pallidum (strain ATCC 26659 / Pp 5 / PN500) TaxID=670386 RepID=D3BUG3_HETP5|nr:hypothetical protein PPL_11783 [Heterostelium album PN500]EFA74751.1 hypothetical protein PPL_11783 [Heterostelium album PN500]|eukprot:XP_020426885.1 hypothetical protein PPL_11783 [Heterostelium album PN500]
MVKAQHKYFFLTMLIAYITTISISTYFNVKKNHCTYSNNILVDSHSVSVAASIRTRRSAVRKEQAVSLAHGLEAELQCRLYSAGQLPAYQDRQPGFKERPNLIAFVASNCKAGGADKRAEYVRELMKHIKVDSYGLCLQNQDKEALNRNTARDRFQAKMDLFKKYKFVLAFENNNVTDYVTEKLPHTYLSGSLPVYMGADNVEDWTPGIAETTGGLPKVGGGQRDIEAPLKRSFERHYNNCVFLAECRVCDRVRQERINAKHSNYQPSSASLATSGSIDSMPQIIKDYVFADEFFVVNDIAVLVIFIISMLYIVLFMFGVYDIIKIKVIIPLCCKETSYFRLKLRPRSKKSSNTIESIPIEPLTTTDYLAVDNQIDTDQQLQISKDTENIQ